VLERDGGNLEKGLPVVIKLDAIPDKDFHGSISSVSSVAGTLERDSVLRYFTCDVAISDAGGDLKRIRPGMNLRADVVLEEYDSCFVVPSSAVTYREKDKQGSDPTARPLSSAASRRVNWLRSAILTRPVNCIFRTSAREPSRICLEAAAGCRIRA
jgi:multidrug efflux pump subunit AcrA (membrane-fusion protein)